MKKIVFIVSAVAIAALLGCTHMPVREGRSGVPVEVSFKGDCVDDHFDDYFECMAWNYGRGDSPAGDGR